jgi:hypothetical protein
MWKRRRYVSFLVPLFILLSLTTAGCSAKGTSNTPSSPELAMASMTGIPADVVAAPVVVQQAYQYAVANPDTLKHIPCYCGCGKMGHKSNYACYVESTDTAGKLTYDSHALGCSICVDITQDVMRLTKQGKTTPEIRAYVDAIYSRYGPSNLSN